MVLLVCEALIFSVVISCDLLVAARSLKKHSAGGKSLGVTCIGAAIVTTSYLFSVFVENYFLYSVLSSIYFIGIDLTLLSLLYFIRSFVMGSGLGKISVFRGAIYVWSIIDTLLLLINPFVEVSIHYVYVNAPISHYTYEMYLPYRLHLMLSYVILAIVMFYLLRKALTVPRMYRRQYLYAILTLVLVVLINAVYLYVPMGGNGQHILDYSLLGYSIAAFLFYWICFTYTEHGLLDLLRNHVFTNLDRGLLVFDYEDKLVLKNEKADELLAGFLQGCEPVMEDMARLLADDAADLPTLGADGRKHSFQCYPSGDVSARPMICDYRVLLGTKDEVLGKLFMFSELTSEYDALTGFCMWDVYKRREAEKRPQLVTAAACDINGLAEINSTDGRSAGDQAIQMLARLMRKSFPPTATFVRGGEATLVAVCDGMGEEDARICVSRMRTRLQEEINAGGRSFDFQSGIKASREGDSRADAVTGAVETLRMRKLLDENSRHSEVLYSLVRMLQACDNDTEAHVRRTQKMGMKLGERIGLTEEQQSNLALLALLHDIGKITIPLDILNKPGKLTEAEWNVLTTHTEKGYQIAKNSPELRGIADMILYHHERWDGKGYPDGLSKESIPLLSRVISVVDSYDAMVNDRPYRKAMTPKQASEELKRCAGTQFDPSLVTEFLQLLVEEGTIDDLPAGDADPAAHAAPAADLTRSLWSMESQRQADQDAPRVHVIRCAHYILDAQERIVQVNEEFTRLTGYTQEDVRSQGLSQMNLIFKGDRDEYGRLVFDELEKQGIAYLEHWIRRKDGSALFVFCCGRRYFSSAVRENRSEIFMSDSMSSYSVQSIIQKEHSKASRRLERWENKFRRDPLTGLLNHEAFKNDVEARLLAGETCALMLMMDIDRFKDYNDTYGHRAGDEFLIMVAQTLMSALRKDDFACRMGGDEFAAMLLFPNGTPREEMVQRAGQVFDRINLTLTASDMGGTSLSMGGAFLDEDYRGFDRLYEAADQALYRSKDAGRAKLSF